ncbi:MAG TPA: chitobiase/beta-hexosaminidase C-terminal domain-containing protein [Opitutaceae bacterium]|nr:chitobiase/beta-hexosaminidase C-terminal domain-containing protein [Opitutaceae bacterium]
MKKPSFLRPSLLRVLALSLLAPIAASAQTRMFAPYIEMDVSDNLPQISSASGIKDFTLAFIISGGSCTASWNGSTPVSSDTAYKPLIDSLRSAGGDVIVCFGGEAGTEVAGTCTSVSSIQAQYQLVVTKYNVKMLDFDIEGAAVADTAAIDRRNQALANLQAANSGLIISYTLPVEPSGLDDNCLNLLKNAKSHGVNVAVVNLMTMDFGGSVNPNAMGQASIDSANAVISQLQSIGVSAKIGITPMIGRNDTSPEIFTVADAQKVLSYAQSNNNISRLTFWSVSRDVSCPGNAAQVSDTCSGITQKQWDFSHVFEAFGGSSGPSQVATLAFNPGGGTYASAQSVTITTSTSGATIRYTTDGSAPSETHGTIYSGPVSIGSTATLKAIGYETGFTDSNITSASYTINTGGGGTPITLEAENLSPVGTGATVSISNDANASGGVIEFLNSTAAGQTMTLTTPSIAAGTYQVQLRYKTNTTRGQHTVKIDGVQVGSTIDQYATTSAYTTVTLGSATLAAGAHTIVLTVTGKNASATQFYITADSFTLTPSSVQSQAAAPSFSPGAGTYTSTQSVTIATSTSGASLRYTTDGSTPSETAGTVYSIPVSISATATLKAIAYESGFTDSSVTSATYTINTGGGGTTVSFEAESLTYTPNGATASVQTDVNSSGGKWIELAGNSVGDYINFAIPSVAAGTYQLQMEWKGNTTRGILQLSVDGTNVGGTVDQYSAAQSYPTSTFGNVTFSSAGTHTIRLTVTGKNSASGNYQLSADKFTFVAQ